ncbi:MAG: Ig-like domain-containing protein, partial [Patescibacteria group bacterium]
KVTFNQPVDEDSARKHIKVTPDPECRFSFVIVGQGDNARTEALCDPKKPLNPNTSYTVRVEPGVVPRGTVPANPPAAPIPPSGGTCANGYTVLGGMCYVDANRDRIPDNPPRNPVNGSCTSGYVLHVDGMCYRDGNTDRRPDVPPIPPVNSTCPNGYTQHRNGFCFPNSGVNLNPDGTCPGDSTFNATDNKCYYPTGGINPRSDGSCQSGYALHGDGLCYPSTGVNPNPNGTCPTFSTFNTTDNKCYYPTGGVPPKSDGSCESGLVKRLDGLCYPNTGVNPNPNGTCPRATTLNATDNMCYYQTGGISPRTDGSCANNLVKHDDGLCYPNVGVNVNPNGTCPTFTTFNTTDGKCYYSTGGVPPKLDGSCNTGLVKHDDGLCYLNTGVNPNPNGTCPSLTTLNTNDNKCYYQTGGIPPNVDGSCNEGLIKKPDGLCYQNPGVNSNPNGTCPNFTNLNTTDNKCYYPTNGIPPRSDGSCQPGYTPRPDGLCYPPVGVSPNINGTCPAGTTFNANEKQCYYPIGTPPGGTPSNPSNPSNDPNITNDLDEKPIKTGPVIEKISRVVILVNGAPKTFDRFTCVKNDCLDDSKTTLNGNQHTYHVFAYATSGELISTNTIRSYIWKVQSEKNTITIPNAPYGAEIDVTAKAINGSAMVSVEVEERNSTCNPDPSVACDKKGAVTSTTVSVENILCENPWEFDSAKVSGFDAYDFNTFYCEGNTGALTLPPLLSTPIPADTSSPIFDKEYIFRFGNSEGIADQKNTDVIAMRVGSNPLQQSPYQWYINTAKVGTSPTPTFIDGYKAVRDAQGVYISIPGKDPDTKLYILSFSYNEGASTQTQQVFNSFINNLKLSADVANADDSGKLRRDVLRLSDMADMKSYLGKGPFPSLAAGSFFKGQTLSAWPSWQSELEHRHLVPGCR